MSEWQAINHVNVPFGLVFCLIICGTSFMYVVHNFVIHTLTLLNAAILISIKCFLVL